MKNSSSAPQIQDVVASVQKALAEVTNPEDKDAALRACLALNVSAYRNRLSVDPKAF
jgi:hypothetical protein